MGGDAAAGALHADALAWAALAATLLALLRQAGAREKPRRPARGWGAWCLARLRAGAAAAPAAVAATVVGCSPMEQEPDPNPRTLVNSVSAIL